MSKQVVLSIPSNWGKVEASGVGGEVKEEKEEKTEDEEEEEKEIKKKET